MAQKFQVLLNQAVKKSLLGLSIKEKEKLKDKFEYLENGIWEGGIRVKKLKGFSDKVIFEARMDKGNRLLFTLGKKESGSESVIYIWGMTRHDDISRSAETIQPDNAPFLTFEPDLTEESRDLVFDELKSDYYTQEDIGEQVLENGGAPYGPQKWLVLNDDEWVRLLKETRPNEDYEIHLYLTREQEEVLRKGPPMLLSGTAGSGKTTLAVYSLLLPEYQNKKRIFITYNDYLKRFSEKIYNGLVKNGVLDQSGPKPEFHTFKDYLFQLLNRCQVDLDLNNEVGLPEFRKIISSHRFYRKFDYELVWEEIRSIIKGSKPQISLARFKKIIARHLSGEITAPDRKDLSDYIIGLKNFDFIGKIEHLIEKKTGYKNFDQFLMNLNEEIQGKSEILKMVLKEMLLIMENKANDFTSPVLSFNEYGLLGRKRAPLFIYDRKEIYDIALYYQNKLIENNLWDEIDLCRKAIDAMDKSVEKTGYDLVVCDETQDFTDIQIHFIFKLTKAYQGIVFAGDPKQIINPSGFRWEEVKDKFYERGVTIPGISTLNLNFRSVGSIVRIANNLLDLKQKLIGLSGTELKERWKFNGKPPFVLFGMEETAVLNNLKIMSAGQIILVRDEKDKQKLKKFTGTEMVFTIHEAKGLEFDSVFIWRFMEDQETNELWNKIIRNEKLTDEHKPHIRYEINLLYVAITRARDTLIFYDGLEYSRLWDIDSFRDSVYKTRDETVTADIWRKTSKPEEWEEQGDYFMEREFYPAALECYKNSGNTVKAELAGAFSLSSAKKYNEAAELFEKHGYFEKAAGNYESGENFEKAYFIWNEKLNNQEKALPARIKMFEKKGEFNLAADEWEKLGAVDKAVNNWEKAGNYRRLSGYYLSKKDYKKAVIGFEKMKDFDNMIFCYKKLNKYPEIAHAYYNKGLYAEAVPFYKKAKDHTGTMNCLRELKDYYQLALVYEKTKDYPEALSCLKKYAEMSSEYQSIILSEAGAFERKKKKISAALRYSAAGGYEKAGELFMNAGLYQLALDNFIQAGNKPGMADCYQQLKRYYELGNLLLDLYPDDQSQLAYHALLNYTMLNGKPDKKRGDQLFNEGKSLFLGQQWVKALTRFKAINYLEGAVDIYLKTDRDEEAVIYLSGFSDIHYLRDFIEKKGNLEISGEFIERIIRYLSDPHIREDLQLYYMRIISKVPSGIISIKAKSLLKQVAGKFLYDGSTKKIKNSDIIDLMIKTEDYNFIYNELDLIKLFGRHNKTNVNMDDSLKQLLSIAQKEGNKGLLACYYLLMEEGQKADEILKDLDINGSNTGLFAKSKGHYQKAVNYYVKAKDIKSAVSIYRTHEEFEQAGRVCEENGEYNQAGTDYEAAKSYSNALRCYEKVGKRKKAAGVYEKMKLYDQALNIYKDLNDIKNINRVLKKINKSGEIELFK